MPALTRRLEQNRHQECWHVFYGNVQVGTITERAGVPVEVDQWGWCCGFYPVSHRGIRADGTAATFEVARAAFEAAWKRYLPRCSDLDFDEYRYQSASTAWKYAMWDAGCKMPMQTVGGRTKCFCGAEIDRNTTSAHIREFHMEITDGR